MYSFRLVFSLCCYCIHLDWFSLSAPPVAAIPCCPALPSPAPVLVWHYVSLSCVGSFVRCRVSRVFLAAVSLRVLGHVFWGRFHGPPCASRRRLLCVRLLFRGCVLFTLCCCVTLCGVGLWVCACGFVRVRVRFVLFCSFFVPPCSF